MRPTGIVCNPELHKDGTLQNATLAVRPQCTRLSRVVMRPPTRQLGTPQGRRPGSETPAPLPTTPTPCPLSRPSLGKMRRVQVFP